MTQLIVDPLQTKTPDPEPDNQADDGLPEKYRGKTAAEIAIMHQNAESELGRARNEVGTLRRLSDEFLGIRRAELEREKAANQPTRQPITTDALLEKPEETILSTVRMEVERAEAAREARTAKMEADLAEAKFTRSFPDAEKTLQDPEFQNWVRSSPYRQRMALQASQGDFDAAGDLFGLYNSTKTETPAKLKESGTDQARKAALSRPGGSSASGVIPGNDGKKIYKREELITMRIKDPEGFARLCETEDINQAYRENRVR